jgi:hypothetical protein
MLAPGRMGLGPVGWLRVRLLVIGRSIRPREGVRRTFGEIRAEVMAKMDEGAYRTFTGRIRFCHDCRRFVCPGFVCPGFVCRRFVCPGFVCPGFVCPGFVCPGCWSRSWSSCKSCVARAMKLMSPTRPRFRLGLSLTVIAASVAVLVVSVGSVLVAAAVH